MTGRESRPPQGPAPESAGAAEASVATAPVTTDDLTRELFDLVDLVATARLRQMSADLSDAEDWGQVAGSIARSRVARNIRADGYQPLDRTPDPWPPESLDPNTWREGVA